jgi:ubiquinone/menaquinone biosynthesis C-methylase UbiE
VISVVKTSSHSDKAALRGEPSYVWRAGQERRLRMILDAAGELCRGSLLEAGCGVGMYVDHLGPHVEKVVGFDVELERLQEAHQRSDQLACAVGEALPFASQSYELVLSNEVLEHVQDDRQAVREMVRVLKPGGRLIVFCPNRGYPFETHGIY